MIQAGIATRAATSWAALLVLVAVTAGTIERYWLVPRHGGTRGPGGTIRLRIDARAARLPERERFVLERSREADALRRMSAGGRAIPAAGLDFVFFDDAGRQVDRYDGVRVSGRAR